MKIIDQALNFAGVFFVTLILISIAISLINFLWSAVSPLVFFLTLFVTIVMLVSSKVKGKQA